jgi:hypothetical protein
VPHVGSLSLRPFGQQDVGVFAAEHLPALAVPGFSSRALMRHAHLAA